MKMKLRTKRLIHCSILATTGGLAFGPWGFVGGIVLGLCISG